MADVAVIGGGPAGLSAALFTSKNGLETILFDTDETWVHSAYLLNYPGVKQMSGDAFVDVAREQVDDHGADRHQGEEVTDIDHANGKFAVETAQETYEARYVVLATGQSRDLAEEIGCEFADDGTVAVNNDGRTSVDRAYAVGWIARKDMIQVAISVGMGAAAALDILSTERGKPFHDFDTPAAIE
ncbi:FAD-dependent oxidoreductase [Halomicrococcus sp. SG-WS-1]|uniref:NAD(P)/FAD-dependent oxidoreductase n=1 Tax=Halomicrococcus sp. SG-WS-1 TaxID=3439057 RepID=UPI003F78EF50